MTRYESPRLQFALLYGLPVLTAAISVAVYVLISKSRFQGGEFLLPLFPLNTVIGVGGAAASGFVGRDGRAARVRGFFDGGAFGLVAHLIALLGFGYAAFRLGLTK